MLGWWLLGESSGLCGSPKGLKKLLKRVAGEDMSDGEIIYIILLLLILAFFWGACPGLPAGVVGPPIN